MNSEIKFRAWEWGKKMIYDITPDVWHKRIPSNVNEAWILMQYIGLNDPNGKEIFVGDIMGVNDDGEDPSRCVVVFQEGAFQRSYLPFISDETKNDSDYYEGDHIHNFAPIDLKLWKVIGNIYQHPELIVKRS